MRTIVRIAVGVALAFGVAGPWALDGSRGHATSTVASPLVLLAGHAAPVQTGSSAVSRSQLRHSLGVREVLDADGIAGVRFGASPSAVRANVDSLLEQAGLAYTHSGGECAVDHVIVWWDHRTANGLPNLVAYFGHSKFVGYQYGEFGTLIRPHPPLHGPELATTRGLRVGDPLARGRALYGRAFTLSSAQGGTWRLRTPGGVIRGYAWGTPSYGDVSWHSVVATIDGGDVGCPALSP